MIKEISDYLFKKSVLLLNRHQLSSINLEDLKETFTEDKIREENAKIANVFPILERKIKLALKKEIDFIARNSMNEQQIYFGRGGINFADLLLEDFELMRNAHIETTKPKEDFNKFKIL